MKKILSSLLLTGLVAVGPANAGQDIELGQGFFFVGSPEPVTMSLDKLAAKAPYDIICAVKAVDANEFPVKLGFYVQDGGTSAWEKTFNDEQQRAVFFPHLSVYQPKDAKLVVKVLEGKGTANPVEYHCYAEDRE